MTRESVLIGALVFSLICSGAEKLTDNYMLQCELILSPMPQTEYSDIVRLADRYGHGLFRLNTRWEFYIISFQSQKKSNLLTPLERNDAIISNYRSSGLFDWVVPNYPVFSSTHIPNDPFYGGIASSDTIPNQFYLDLIGANRAWDRQTGENSVRIGIVSSGVDMDHPDLIANISSTEGYDFVGGVVGSNEEAENPGIYAHQEDSNPDVHIGNDGWSVPDPSIGNGLSDFDSTIPPDNAVSHGTMIAGIISSETDNSLMFSGISQSTIVPIRAINPEGWAYLSDILQAIDYAASLELEVVYLGFTVSSDPSIESAIDSLNVSGAAIVAPVGDNNSDTLLMPAGHTFTMGVGSCTSELDKSSFSSIGIPVDLVAPGGETEWDREIELIWSTGVASVADSLDGYIPGQPRTSYGVGTSFSAAMVAGVLALMRSEDPSLTNIECYDIIEAASTDIIHTGWDSLTGHGLLNAYNAVRIASIRENPEPELISISIHPNPFNDKCLIYAEGDILIYDIEGKLIEKLENKTGQLSWTPRTTSPSGVYLISTRQNETRSTVKAIYMK